MAMWVIWIIDSIFILYLVLDVLGGKDVNRSIQCNGKMLIDMMY